MPEVHVFMAEGKTDEQKRHMMTDITHALVKNLDCAAEAVTVQIIEAGWSDKMKVVGSSRSDAPARRRPVLAFP